MTHIRAHIRLNTPAEAEAFCSALNSLGNATKYSIEDFSGAQRANARSLLGVIYAMTDYNDTMYFVSENDILPSCIDAYRVEG